MISFLRRTIKYYIPNEQILFNKQGKRLIFEYHNDNISKTVAYWIAAISSVSIFHYSVTHTYNFAIIGLSFSIFSFVSAYRQAAKTVNQMYLFQDGKNIEIITYNLFKKKTLKIPIDNINCFKGKQGFSIIFNKKNYLLDQEGKIFDLNLFYAVLRNLNVDSEKFLLEDLPKGNLDV